MTLAQRAAGGGKLRTAAAVIERANGIVRRSPLRITQLVLRLALAVPFWRSGILKWDGFLQLSDNAVYLFSDEFKLHLPGGPYDFPGPPSSPSPPARRRSCCRSSSCSASRRGWRGSGCW